MILLSCSIRLHRPGGPPAAIPVAGTGSVDPAAGTRSRENRDAAEAPPRPNVKAEVRRSGHRLQVFMTTMQPVILDQLKITWHEAFLPDDRVFVNGWQSWTESCERSVQDTVTGLNRVPRSAVRRWSMDSYGDYRFASYSLKPGRFHGWSYCYIRSKKTFCLYASLSEASGFSKFTVDTSSGKVYCEKEVSKRVYQGSPEEPQTYCLVDLYLDVGSEQEVFDGWFAAMDIHPRRQEPAQAYTSWYRHGHDIDELKLLHDLAGVRWARSHSPYVLFPFNQFIIDDGWASHMGDWLKPDVSKFPEGMPMLRDAIRRADLTPGIWIAPFVAEKDSELIALHPDWFLLDEKAARKQQRKDSRSAGQKNILQSAAAGGAALAGRALTGAARLIRMPGSRNTNAPDPSSDGGTPEESPKDTFLCAGSNWSGIRVLDFYNEDARAYIRKCIETIVHEWGFSLLKMDFLYAVCMQTPPDKTRGQVMTEAMEFLRDCAGDAEIFACGTPLMPAFGVADFCRVTCDTGEEWDDHHLARYAYLERNSARGCLLTELGRRHLNGRAFQSGSDTFTLKLSGNVNSPLYQRSVDTAKIDALCNGLLAISDDVMEYSPEMKQLVQALPYYRNGVIQSVALDHRSLTLTFTLDGEKEVIELKL